MFDATPRPCEIPLNPGVSRGLQHVVAPSAVRPISAPGIRHALNLPSEPPAAARQGNIVTRFRGCHNVPATLRDRAVRRSTARRFRPPGPTLGNLTVPAFRAVQGARNRQPPQGTPDARIAPWCALTGGKESFPEHVRRRSGVVPCRRHAPMLTHRPGRRTRPYRRLSGVAHLPRPCRCFRPGMRDGR